MVIKTDCHHAAITTGVPYGIPPESNAVWRLSDNLPMSPAPIKQLPWNNRFARLGEKFYTRVQPQALPDPYWISRNQAVARELGIDADWFESQDVLQALSGSGTLSGSDPLASVYSGHQFGQWAGQLGDGRAILLGELETPSGQQEIQLKGAGKTPYSRMGDGRAVLRRSEERRVGKECW